jgi:RHS repeat-associated protein
VAQRFDANGTLVSVYASDAFGNKLAGTQETYSYNAKYGYYFDAETGFYYCTHRYYDPANGRWLTEDPIGFEGGFNLYGYCGNGPVGSVDPSGYATTLIGYVYTIKGIYKGKVATYVGSASDLFKRLSPSHMWEPLLRAETTTIEVTEIYGEVNVGASGRGTLRSATNEALRSVEQTKLKPIKGTLGNKNRIFAATEKNAALWAERHSVEAGETVMYKGGRNGIMLKCNAVGCGIGILIDAYLMYREQKLASYGEFEPYILQDSGGTFSLQIYDPGIFNKNSYYKNYLSGTNSGQRIMINKGQFDEFKLEGEAMWGKVDFWGNWIPGLLRRKLPVVNSYPSGMI